VGKTSAAVNLGALAAHDGRRTLLWDLDPQGAASFLLRVKPKVKGAGRKLVRGRRDPFEVPKGTAVEGLDLLPADFSYRHLDLVLDRAKKLLRGLDSVLASLADGYDLAILDCAPSISLVSENVFDAADLLLVPLVPSTLSVRTLEQLHRFLAPSSSGRRRCSRSSRWSIGASACTVSSCRRCPVPSTGWARLSCPRPASLS
jgi:chromosome partitioning protein